MSLNNQTKEMDPSAENIPFGIDWTRWLQKLGPNVTLIESTWPNIASPFDATPEIILTWEGTFAVLNLDANGAAPGVYEFENHVKASNGVEDSRRLYIRVREL